MNIRPAYVSVIDPIGPAIERVKTVLFRPFDLGKWFVIGFLTAVTFLALGGVLAFFSYRAIGFTAFTILGLVMCGLLFLATMIVFGTISWFTTDFVVPIMYLQGLRCTKAWKVFLDILGNNQGRFILYLLFHLVISMTITVLLVAVSCATCCIACCLFNLPFIGAVVLLPVSMFQRSYSLYYLAQYGREFNVFPPEPETAPAGPEMQL